MYTTKEEKRKALRKSVVPNGVRVRVRVRVGVGVRVRDRVRVST